MRRPMWPDRWLIGLAMCSPLVLQVQPAVAQRPRLNPLVACAYPVLGGESELKRRTTEGFKVLLVAGRPARP